MLSKEARQGADGLTLLTLAVGGGGLREGYILSSGMKEKKEGKSGGRKGVEAANERRHSKSRLLRRDEEG